MGTASFRRKLLKGRMCPPCGCSLYLSRNNVSDRVDVQVASLCIGSFVFFVCVFWFVSYTKNDTVGTMGYPSLAVSLMINTVKKI